MGSGEGDYEHEVFIGAVPGGVLVPLPPWAKEPAARRRRNLLGELIILSNPPPAPRQNFTPHPEPLYGVEAADMLQGPVFSASIRADSKNGEVQLVAVVLGLVFDLGTDIMVVEPPHEVCHMKPFFPNTTYFDVNIIRDKILLCQ